jgi:predicted nucleic acid-binding protein
MASPRIVIANTTPLVNFAEIDRLGLLRQLFQEIVVPKAVVAELQAKRAVFPKAAAVPGEAFLRISEAPNTALSTSLARELHSGEAECLALALRDRSALLLLDELSARSIAEYHGLRFTGTVGCLRLAKDMGLIPSVAPLLEDLRVRARFWLAPDLVRRVLSDAGELTGP